MKKSCLQLLFVALLTTNIGPMYASQEVTPIEDGSYEAFIQEVEKASYVIPSDARFTVARDDSNTPYIICYMSKPKDVERYPIAILCTGSSNRSSIHSVIYFHRSLLQWFLDLGVGVITVEQWGVDGNTVDVDAFMEHYTRSERLQDHCRVIDHLKEHPPAGWDGRFIFLGVSEGGPLVTRLTQWYPDDTVATINWCGAGDWPWRDELWVFLEDLRRGFPWWMKALDVISQWVPFAPRLPKNKAAHVKAMDSALADPCVDREYLGMSYLYHADAQTYPEIDYAQIKTPFLAVAGAQDSFVQSCDAFVQTAKDAGADITYLRVDDMDHYIGRRPEIVAQSFAWLQEQL